MTYFDLGPYQRKITTSSADAQLWFDRGLNWLFGFNHGEAIKCFARALDHDSQCAMAHWGVSYASGPNYNLPWHLYDPHGRQMALGASYDAMQRALTHAHNASPVEQAMVRALSARYPQREAIEDMAPWDKAYTDVMREAVDLDDALPYDEPWGWMQPARHALGALLLEQGEVAEAEAVYRSDLGLDGKLSRACQHPDNLWSLHGLHECLTHRGEKVEAPLIKQRLDLALARAEVPIKASCFCRQVAMAAE
ncbi:MAG: hypothetical protein HOI95_15995 [Chromatiales bacterium]|nr:hypothetical protein [Chromatiales bacterium]